MLVELRDIGRFDAAKLEIKAHRRTVIVGTNNSGKTTLVEWLAKAFSALPAIGVNIQSMNSSSFREGMDIRSRPMVKLSFAPHEFGVKTEQHESTAEIEFTFASASRRDQIDVQAPSNTHLAPVLIRWNGVRLAHSPHDLQTVAQLAASPILVATQSLIGQGDAWSNENLAGSHNYEMPYGRNTALSRALKHVAENVFYLTANRAPVYGPSGSDRKLSRHHLLEVTPYLKRLKLRPKDWNEFQSSIQVLFEEVAEIDLREIGDQLAPFARVQERWMPIDSMGYGFRNAMHLLAVLAAAPQNSMLLIDEPEIGLNQAKQRDLAHLFEVFRPDVTMVVATQSEAFCKAFGATTDLHLVERTESLSALRMLNVRGNNEDRLALAKTMGMDPLYLLDGGKIIFVEGKADREIITQWLQLHIGDLPIHVVVQDLGGCGKIAEEFAKPLFEKFRDRIFFVLDSDGTSSQQTMGPNIRRLVDWLISHAVTNHYVLKRREIENYLGRDALAKVVNIHPGVLPDERVAPWVDFKAAIKAANGFYEEAKTPIAAYRALSADQRRELFDEENEPMLRLLRAFISA